MIEQTIDYIISKSTPECAEGWLDDAEHYFCQHEAWSVATALITRDPRCLLELKSIVSTSVDSLGDLTEITQAIWHALAWSFEASATYYYREACVLRFITVVNDNSSCVTGRMIIAGDHYHELVRRYENHQHKKLPTIPFDFDLRQVNTQLLGLEQQSIVRHDKDWNDDELLIPETMTLINRIERCVAARKESFFDSEVSQDALRFNLEALARTSRNFSMDLTDVSDWRNELLKIAHPSKRLWQQDPNTIWTMAKEHVPKLLPIIDDYRRKHDAKT